MAGYRIKRVNEQLRREISEILLGEVKDPRVGAVTVTAVSTAPDLTFARVYVRIVGDEGEERETLKGLRAASAFIRLELGKRLPLRRVPELRFEVDRSLERAQRIEALLAEVVPDDSSETDDSGETDDEADDGGVSRRDDAKDVERGDGSGDA